MTQKIEREAAHTLPTSQHASRDTGAIPPKKAGYYFDPIQGWVTPSDEYESDTNKFLKEIITELKSGVPTNSLHDAVEQLLYKYAVFIRQGREDMGSHLGVSWYLTDYNGNGQTFLNGSALISYQEGPRTEWHNDCYADEVPIWLLTALLHRIARRKPLGDQKADETIQAIEKLDTEYNNRALDKPLKLNVVARRFGSQT
jgi:hypothetical protein